jgi:hypothetical protein
MTTIKKTQYLIFEDQEISKKKTKVISVININADDIIGIIKWYGPWRQYCFFPEFDTVWNITCLTDVNEVIGNLMLDRKTKK